MPRSNSLRSPERRPLPARLAADGLAGLWDRAWNAMARAGPAGWETVTVRVPLGSDAERHAVGGLRGRPIRPGTASVELNLGGLDRLIRQAGDEWDLPAVVDAAVGPLPDRAATTAARRTAIEAAVTDAHRRGPKVEWFDAWIGELSSDGTLARLHGRGELALLAVAASVLAMLPDSGRPLPVVAAQATGDTKALDRGALASLVLRGIACSLGEPRPKAAADRRALWEAAGVVPDDLASQVLVLNLPVRGHGLGEWLRDAAGAGVPFRVTLHQLVRFPLEVTARVPVFVCENPAVLRVAAERLAAAAAPIVCTEGRPSVACTRLLDLLGAGGCELRYHGDFDWPGLRIAAAILGRADSVPWRFGAGDFRAASPAGRQRLSGPAAASPWDPTLADAMARTGVVVYEEDVLDNLLADLGA